MLAELLYELETLLKENYKKVYDSLAPGATDEQFNLLQEKCFAGKAIPEDFIMLYKWHNGQNGYASLNQEDNYTFLPIEEIIESWTFLNDPLQDILEPISKSWIPFAYNGAGDYLVYEVDGDMSGKIINYWHDDEERPIECNSLMEWVQNAVEAAQA